MEKLFINVTIGVIAIGGFFWYWSKNSGVFKEGGVIYEWWKKRKENKPTKKQ